MPPKLQDFLLCRECSITPGGLVDVQGLIAGNILVPRLGSADQVACVVILRDMAGVSRYDVHGQVKADATTLGTLPAAGFTRDAAKDSHVHVQRLRPFPMPREGQYVFELAFSFGDFRAVYRKVVTVRVGSSDV